MGKCFTRPDRLKKNSSIRKEKEYRGSIEKHITRSNHARDSQTIETQETSTPMGVASTPELGEIRHHLPIDEKDSGDNIRKRPVHGTRHGNNSRPFHSGEDVDIIKHYNTDH